MYKIFSNFCSQAVKFLVAIFLLISLLPFDVVRASDFVPPVDEVVVKLKSGVNIETILERYDATQFSLLAETNLYFLKLNEQDASELLPVLNDDSDLYYAEPNYYTESPTGQLRFINGHMAYVGALLRYINGHDEDIPSPPDGDPYWAWQRINLPDAGRISDGSGVVVAILDTGLAADHSLLNSSLVGGYDFVQMKEQILDQGNGIDDDQDGQVDEQTGHGTHVAGIILSTAPGARLMPIRVLNSDGIGTYWEMAAGIRYAVDHGAKVINMSLSAPLLPDSLQSALDYAAEHDVVVVAAAGDGDGPNYPAAYTAHSTILGVGATDMDDAVAFFSGGQPQDTDIYAPGVNIYSSFPYNQYVYASGTSMSAPMVAAEAALLLSRHPEWSAQQVVERIITQVDDVDLPAGRVNLRAALNTGLEVQYMVGDPGCATNDHIVPRVLLVNNTPQDIPLSEITMRYWYSVDGDRPQSLACDYASAFNCWSGSLTGSFFHLDSPDADTVVEVGFTNWAGVLVAGARDELILRIHKDDWSDYDEWDDYSFNAEQVNAFAPAPQISLYYNGDLAWGIEPSQTLIPVVPTPSPTQTSPHPTAHAPMDAETVIWLAIIIVSDQ